MHTASTSILHIPAMVTPQHKAFTFHYTEPPANPKHKHNSRRSCNPSPISSDLYVSTSGTNHNFISFRSQATKFGTNLIAHDAESQNKSTFDAYLKEMELIRTRRTEKKEREEKEKKGRTASREEVTGGDSTEGSLPSDDAGFRRRSGAGDGSKEHLDKLKLDGSRLKKDDVRERKWEGGLGEKVGGLKSETGKRNKEGLGKYDTEIGLSKGERDGFDSGELFEGDVHGGRKITRMEMEERIQKLARSLNGEDINMPEWKFSKMMRSAQIRFSDHSILRVIQVLGKLGNWRRVLQVIEWLQMRERFKSHKLRFIYTSALDVLGKAKRPVEALNLYRVMQKEKSTYPDLVAYHCLAVTLGQAGHLKELFEVIDSMRSIPKNFKIKDLDKWDTRLEPDMVVYNAILNACVKRKQWEGAFWVLQQLKQAGQQPSSTTYGLVMEVMMACAKYNLVHDFFEKAQKSSIPNALTYRVLVNAFWREGKTDEAVEAVKEMEGRGIVGSASLYYDLARCLCTAGRCQEALKHVDKICKVATKPLVVSYTGLIQACLDAKRVHDATYIFNQMHEHCSPNLVTYNTMLKAFLEHGMYNEAKYLFFKMLQNDGRSRGRGSGIKGKDGVKPDIYTFKMMLEAFVNREKWGDFEYGYEEMLRRGHHFNTKGHLWMVLRCCRAGNIGPIETTWKHLMKGNRIPPPALIKERFLLKLETDDLRAALLTVSSHPSAHQEAFSKSAWMELLSRPGNQVKLGSVQKLASEADSYLLISQPQPPPKLIFENLIEACKELVGT